MFNNSNIFFSSEADIPAIVSLANSAYRGDSSKKGWTTEAHLLEGELRTDTISLAQLLQKPEAAILKHLDDEGSITGCVYLEKQDKKIYLGLLSVSPDKQAKGIGKKLLVSAEEYARNQNCSSIIMNVISVRQDLISWYVRHGYHPTGETRPFPVDTRYGVPTQLLELIVLQKNINP